MDSDDQAASAAQESPAEQAQRQRKTMRVVMQWWAIIFGALIIVFGRHYTINGIYAPYLGGVFVAVGILAECGVNVWWGGPLDKRLDKRLDKPAS